MPRKRLTPEEKHARKLTHMAAYRARNHAKLAKAQRERNAKHVAQKALMSPEEQAVINAPKNTRQRRSYQANLAERRIKGAAYQKARRAAMTPEEREADKAYHRQQNVAYRLRHGGKINAKARDKRSDNPERFHVYERRYRANHPETVRAGINRWHKANPDSTARISKKWREANPDYLRNWRQANPELTKAQAARRWARSRGATTADLTPEQWRFIQEAQNHRCAYCGKRCKGRLTQDHITPVSKGGSHTLHNVIGACQKCNSRKGTKAAPKLVQPLLL